MMAWSCQTTISIEDQIWLKVVDWYKLALSSNIFVWIEQIEDLYNARKASNSWIQKSFFNGDIKGKAAKTSAAKQVRCRIWIQRKSFLN